MYCMLLWGIYQLFWWRAITTSGGEPPVVVAAAVLVQDLGAAGSI